jgi:hypothetical protein
VKRQFYRVLTPGCEGVPGTLERWLQRKLTSTHSETPGHWLDIWNTSKSTNLADYPLSWNGITYTVDARSVFLRFAPTHQAGELWPTHELNQTGEYEGVSAYDNVRETLQYGLGAPGKLYVVFEGTSRFRLPEVGGHAVEFHKELLPPMRSEDFLQWIRDGCRVKGKLGTYGCACRCLLKLLADAGTPTEDDDFVAAFTPIYPHWATHCGLTDTAIICELAKRLGLAGSVQVFRDYEKVVTETKTVGYVGTLVCVERMPLNVDDHHAGLGCVYHCMLLKDIDQTNFVLWSPQQDGSDSILLPFTRDFWDKLLAHALVLKR